MNRSIVVIDDNTGYLEFVTTLLSRAGFEAHPFNCAKKAMKFVQQTEVALVITDVFMPDMDGIEVLRMLQRVAPQVSVIGISGLQASFGYSYLEALRALGASAILQKPCDPQALLAEIKRLLEDVSLESPRLFA